MSARTFTFFYCTEPHPLLAFSCYLMPPCPVHFCLPFLYYFCCFDVIIDTDVAFFHSMYALIMEQISRARADHQSWLRELEVAETPKAKDKQEKDADSSSSANGASAQDEDQTQQQQPSATNSGSNTQAPWPEPDFYRIHVVAQEGAAVGAGVDSDGSAPMHTLEYGTVVMAYER